MLTAETHEVRCPPCGFMVGLWPVCSQRNVLALSHLAILKPVLANVSQSKEGGEYTRQCRVPRPLFFNQSLMKASCTQD